MTRSGRRAFVASLLLLSVSLLLSGLAGEVFLRLLGYRGEPQAEMNNVYATNDPVLDWRYAPHSEYRAGNVVYRFNAAGFRDVEHAVVKRAGVQRLLVLGDSVTQGLGVRWEHTFSAQVQDRLGPGVEVVTVAQAGLNTPQEVHLLEQSGLAYDPDLVVVNFVLNDCDFYSKLQESKRYNERADSQIKLLFGLPVNPRLKQTLKTSALIYFVKSRLENIKGRISGRQYTDYFTRIWGQERNRRKITEGFDRLAELQRERGFGVVVIIWPLITDYQHYGFSSIHQWVSREADKRGFSTIDLLPAFSVEPYRSLQVTAEDNVHPNGRGHEVAAERFVAWFHQNGG